MWHVKTCSDQEQMECKTQRIREGSSEQDEQKQAFSSHTEYASLTNIDRQPSETPFAQQTVEILAQIYGA